MIRVDLGGSCRWRAGEGVKMAGWRAVVLTGRFGSELAMLALLAVVGARAGGGVVASVLLGIAAPLAAAAVWAVAVAPKARRRLADPARLAVELALFAATAVGLAAVGLGLVAVLFAVAAAGFAVLVRRYATGM
jgi:hypothetical protein